MQALNAATSEPAGPRNLPPEGAIEAAAAAAAAATNGELPPQGAQHRRRQQFLLRRLDLASYTFVFLMQLFFWWRSALVAAPSGGLERLQHTHQLIYTCLAAACILATGGLPHAVWCKHRTLIIAAGRLAAASVPAQRSAKDGAALVWLHRPATPGLWGACLSWLHILLGTRILPHLAVLLFIPQPPLALVLTQSAYVYLVTHNKNSCATPLLAHPLSRARIKAAWLLFDATPLAGLFLLPGGTSSAEEECMAVLAFLRVLLSIIVPTLVAAHRWPGLRKHLLAPAGEEQPAPPQAGQPTSWRLARQRAVAALGTWWGAADGALIDACTGRGYFGLQLVLAWLVLVGHCWALCKAKAWQGDPAVAGETG